MNSPSAFNKIFILFLSFFYLYAAPALSTDYYVNPADPAASDTGPGTQSQPWQRCPGMPGWTGSISLNPGDTVFFHNTGTWSTDTGNAVLQVTGGVTYDGASWGNGDRATFRAEGELSRSVINVMQDDPVHPTVIRGFHVDVNRQITSGICINWPNMSQDLLGAKKVIDNCIVHDVNSAADQGKYEYGILAGGWFGFKVYDVEITRCEVFNIERSGISLYPGNDDPSGRIEHALIRGNTVYNCGPEPGAGFGIGLKNAVIDAVVEYNTIYDTDESGIIVTTHPEPGFHGPRDIIIRHNIIRDSARSGILIQQRGDKRVDIVGNLIFNNAHEGIKIASNLEDVLELGVYNNTFYHNYVMDWSQEIRVYGSAADFKRLELMNNIIYASEKTRCLVDDEAVITDHSHNVYYRETGRTTVISGDDSYWYTDTHHYEATAMIIDPGLADPEWTPAGFSGEYGVDMAPDAGGLNLTVFSPAKDFGTALPDDFATGINSTQRPIGEGWDAGAYEFRDQTGNFLRLNQTMFYPGDPFALDKRAINSDSVQSLFWDIVVLDVYGAVYFWPGWTPAFDAEILDLPYQTHDDRVLLEFTWPATNLYLPDLAVYAGLLDLETAMPVGEITHVSFSGFPSTVSSHQ
ncbi:MAG TPA: right-handed parallel beta-helix repeat-containing protein [bacterium]|nr:right-handed parallel beta-helix repeat-containing protein [bacterium]